MSIVINQSSDLPELRAVAGTYRVLLSGSDTGGRLAVVEQVLPPGAIGAAPHIHRAHEEDFVVLDGEITFDADLDGRREVRVVGAGGAVSVPRGEAHGFRNESTEVARCIVTVSPAGYENYFRLIDQLVSSGHTPTADELTELRARFGTDPA